MKLSLALVFEQASIALVMAYVPPSPGVSHIPCEYKTNYWFALSSGFAIKQGHTEIHNLWRDKTVGLVGEKEKPLLRGLTGWIWRER